MSTINPNNPPVFNWMPPDWPVAGPKPDLATDPNFQVSAPRFNNPDEPKGPNGFKLNGNVALKTLVDKLKQPGNLGKSINHFTADKDVEKNVGDDKLNPLTSIPHPDSDFRHVEPGFDGTDIDAAIDTLRGLKGQASQDGEAEEAFDNALPPLLDLKQMLSPDAKGMQRLKLLSDNTLVNVATLFGAMNLALRDNDRNAYIAAVDDYKTLITDLDDSEPHTVAPGMKGYGRVVKWFYIRPIIHRDPTVDPIAQIKGAVVMAKWNPHLSSSGIPIPHS